MFQPSMSIEITTKGCFAEPVLWHTSTLLPAADDDVVVGACVWTDTCVELEWLTLPCVELEFECLTVECPFAFPFECDDAVTLVVDFECLVRPGAFADFPCTACCASCFFTWPGAFPEFPGDEGGP